MNGQDRHSPENPKSAALADKYSIDARPGTVYLVGAGTGDPGLMTVRACELIGKADVILYDRLIPQEALSLASADAELIYVGKEGNGPSVPQQQTEETILKHARAGKQVVRLKGGDSFLFGRGGEEALALRQARIPFEVVPGITAGLAAPAYAGIPVTHRDISSAVAFVTGHEDPNKPFNMDWEALARFPGTLVFYMGVRSLPNITSNLIANGRRADEPVAIIQRGTYPDQRTVLSSLQEIAAVAEREHIQAPAITLIGPVAEFAEKLDWVKDRPLHGRTIVVTRARAQASALSSRLRELGASVVEAPTIRTVSLPVRLPKFQQYDLIAVTSPTGAHELFTQLSAENQDARALAGCQIAAIGPGTAQALLEHGIKADILPGRSVAEGLVERLSEIPLRRVLIARGKQGRDVLPNALRERGVEVDFLILYETVAEKLSEKALHAASNADCITFTSASTVRFFIDAAGTEVFTNSRVASIGPATSATLREFGINPEIEAETHSPIGLVEALVRHLSSEAVSR